MYVRFATLVVLMNALAVGTACGQSPWGRMTGLPTNYNLPPAHRLMEPGPGVGGPGPGVIPPPFAGRPNPGPPPMVQVAFNRPEEMQVRWDVGGVARFDSQPLIVPGRKSFPTCGKYHLKITGIAGREGLELYPTLEIAPTLPRTAAYLDHTAIPIQFTEEDFDQVQTGNFVTKVIYLPDPEFQELAIAGVDTLVSTRLDPGVDPIVEADRRGAILAIIRIGNKDLEVPAANGNGITQASHAAMRAASGYAGPQAMPYSQSHLAPNYISGVTSPSYGMPITGTPIALPGPPHIPLGGPAGLQSHTMYNHTHRYIPGPTEALKMHLKQKPGMAYPAPADRVFIKEQVIHPSHHNRQPASNMNYGHLPPQAATGQGHGRGRMLRHRSNCGCQSCQDCQQ
jgi:hypothetical protein